MEKSKLEIDVDKIVTDSVVIDVLGKKRSTYYYWKKTKPLEVALIKEAILLRKAQKGLTRTFEVLNAIR